MSNYLQRAKTGFVTGVGHMDDHRSTVGGVLVGKGERYLGAAIFGLLKGTQREKFAWKGVPGDAWAGLALNVIAGLMQAFAHGKSRFAPHISAFGDAAAMSYIGSKATGYGIRSSGRKLYMLEKGATAPSKLPAGMTAVGATDMSGAAYLSDTEIAKFSNKR